MMKIEVAFKLYIVVKNILPCYWPISTRVQGRVSRFCEVLFKLYSAIEDRNKYEYTYGDNIECKR